MKLAVETMRISTSENRTDKTSPLVGSVIVLPDGSIETACRGELADGDHAEYTLLERKLKEHKLAGATLFCTLEPCAPGARSPYKTSCAERIVSRYITNVWVGIEDPDPLVDSRGIQYLQDHGVTVEMFDRDLQDEIRQVNMDFIKGAEERASRYEGDKSFIRVFTQLRYIATVDDNVHPTGLGILLFGKNPQFFFPQAIIRATLRTAGRNEDITTFSGSIPKQAKDCHEWFKGIIGKQSDRTSAERKVIYDYPVDVVRECVNNALAHRSYEIQGASVHLEISDDTIIVRSPGGPVKPISMERIQRLDAPYLSKNPKITFVFEKLDLSEGRGLGFETIRNLPTLYNLPLPAATFDDPYLNFAFSRAYGNGNGNNERLATLSKTEAMGYDYIRLNSPVTRKMYEEHLLLAGKTARRHLAHFVKLNLIKKLGAGPSTSYEII